MSRKTHISKEDERVLIVKAKAGDNASIDALLIAHQGFIRKQVVAEYKKFNRGRIQRLRWNEVEDTLMQAGRLGLKAAIERFNLATSYRLLTLAGLHIMGSIRRELKGMAPSGRPQIVSLDEQFEGGSAKYDIADAAQPDEDGRNMAIDIEAFGPLLGRIMQEELSSNERRAMQERVFSPGGATQKVVARNLGISHQRIDQLCRSGSEKIAATLAAYAEARGLLHIGKVCVKGMDAEAAEAAMHEAREKARANMRARIIEALKPPRARAEV